MLLAVNAVLYVAALSLALCVLTPVPEGATRRVRAARMSLALGGGAAMAGAITLTFVGLWVESAVVGCFALIVVVTCLWVALSSSSSEHDDGEDGSDGGGGRPRRPIPPAPPEPLGGPDSPLADWTDFDALRAGWARERERQPAGV
jgi:hypothetical protein